MFSLFFSLIQISIKKLKIKAKYDGLTDFKTKFWAVSKTSQTLANPVITVTQDSWDPLLITLSCATGTATTLTITITVTDIIDNDGYNSNSKSFDVSINIKSVNPPDFSVSTDIITEGSTPNSITCK